jgi:hypothetical protein
LSKNKPRITNIRGFCVGPILSRGIRSWESRRVGIIFAWVPDEVRVGTRLKVIPGGEIHGARIQIVFHA